MDNTIRECDRVNNLPFTAVTHVGVGLSSLNQPNLEANQEIALPIRHTYYIVCGLNYVLCDHDVNAWSDLGYFRKEIYRASSLGSLKTVRFTENLKSGN